jgi:Tn3 transposase DDE domain
VQPACAIAQALTELLPRVDRLLDQRDGIRIQQGKLIVPLDEGEHIPESVKALSEEIGRRLPQVDLTDVLLEVDQWTGFSHHLTHAGGGQPRTDDLLLHLHAAVMGQGTNICLIELAHHVNLTYDRLAWVSTWFLPGKTLKAAVAARARKRREPSGKGGPLGRVKNVGGKPVARLMASKTGGLGWIRPVSSCAIAEGCTSTCWTRTVCVQPRSPQRPDRHEQGPQRADGWLRAMRAPRARDHPRGRQTFSQTAVSRRRHLSPRDLAGFGVCGLPKHPLETALSKRL